MRTVWMYLAACCLLCSMPASAGTMLFDFENEIEVKAWHDEGRTTNRNFPVSREASFATSGKYALCLRTPQWKQGMGEWPAVEANPAVKDWTGYDRLFFAVTNPTPFSHGLSLFISDSRQPIRKGLSFSTVIGPHSYAPVVVPLAGLVTQNVDVRDVTTLHFFTQRPVGDMEICLDSLQLLKPGEKAPEASGDYIKQFAALQQRHLPLLRQMLQEARDSVRDTVSRLPRVAAWANARLANCEQQVEQFAKLVAQGDPAMLKGDELSLNLQSEIATVKARAALRAEFEPVRLKTQVAQGGADDVVVGFATSMQKVLPRGVPPTLSLAPDASLALARNEKEALQVVVLPCEQPLKQVQVRVRDLRIPGGAAFADRCIEPVPVGYVETKARPPYGTSHIGWWPDPILDFMDAADVQPGDAQAFWVRFRAPKDQQPGLYRGKLEVLAAGKPLYSFDLRVEVYPFTLPDRSPLDLAVTFSPHDHPTELTKAQQAEWRKSEEYPINAWKKHRLQWGDFLADYYLTYDSLYHSSSPDFEILKRLHERGQLGRFNLGYYAILSDKPAEQEVWREKTLKRIKAAYEQAKALGLLDHAYIYGCDENPAELFPGVQRAAEVFKQECPGVTVMTTTYDHSFGTNSVIKSMDAFCPLTPKYDRALADQVRAKGQQVWWYICCGPHHPFANMFVEYPAIEGRVLMGAQTAKYRPDGFLYYQTSIWNSQKPITGGPFTDWDPRSWTTYHGDGSWICVGPDGTPLPTIRLENFRDGLEDYAYARLLEKAISSVEAGPAADAKWLERAKAALSVPSSLCRSMTEYTSDPADVYRWRRQMAEALKSAPLAPGEMPTL